MSEWRCFAIQARLIMLERRLGRSLALVSCDWICEGEDRPRPRSQELVWEMDLPLDKSSLICYDHVPLPRRPPSPLGVDPVGRLVLPGRT